MALVSRDAFARTELHRSESPVREREDCDWCGNTNARGRLYNFRIETDGGRSHPIKGRFCSVACMRDYHS